MVTSQTLVPSSSCGESSFLPALYRDGIVAHAGDSMGRLARQNPEVVGELGSESDSVAGDLEGSSAVGPDVDKRHFVAGHERVVLEILENVVIELDVLEKPRQPARLADVHRRDGS